MWKFHKMITINKDEKIDRLFGSSDWLKELVLVVIVDSILFYPLSFIFPWPYNLVIWAPLLFLVIWILHKWTIKKQQKHINDY